MKKRLILLFMLLFPLLLTAQQSSNYFYYYYKGEKQYLELNTNYLFISSATARFSQQDAILFPNDNVILNKIQLTGKIITNDKIINSYWGEIKLNESLSEQDYLELIKVLDMFME